MPLYPDIFEAVNGAQTVVEPDGCLFGEENLATQGAPPRIVWVPTSDAFSPAQERGSERVAEHAIHTAQSAVDIHLWGEDSGAALALRDVLLRALRTVLGPNYHLRGGSWRGQNVSTAGRVYVLALVIDVPITTGPVSTATPTTADQADIAFTIPP